MAEYTVQDLQDNLNYINETKLQIKQAIIDKQQPVSDNDTFRSYVDKIRAIETGIKTDDATAVASDIISPKTAYVSDQKITGTMELVENNTYNLNLTPIELSVTTAQIEDVSPDGKLFAKVSGKTITVYKIDGTTPVSLFSQSFSVSYNFSSCRFANAYEEIEGGKLLNVYAASCGHDGDAYQVGCIRIKLSNDGNISKYTSLTSGNLASSWEGNYTNIYPHPNYPNIVMVIAAGRQEARGTHLRLMQISNTTISKIYNVDKPSAYNSDFSACYDYTHGQWGEDKYFYLQDTTLNLTYRVLVNITDGVATSASISTLSGYTTGFKSFTKNYCIINRALYDITGASLLKSYSSALLYQYNLLFETETGLFIYTTLSSNAVLYYVDIENSYNLVEVQSFQSSGQIYPFNNSGSHRIYDKVRITCRLSNPGIINIITSEAKSYAESISRLGTKFYNTGDTSAVAANILTGKTAYNFGGKITGSMPNRGARVMTPSTSNQTILRGYHSGGGYVVGDANLVPGNIREGATIFGVEGTNVGLDQTSDATASANDLLFGKTAYVDGVKITGNIQYNYETSGTTFEEINALGKSLSYNFGISEDGKYIVDFRTQDGSNKICIYKKVDTTVELVSTSTNYPGTTNPDLKFSPVIENGIYRFAMSAGAYTYVYNFDSGSNTITRTHSTYLSSYTSNSIYQLCWSNLSKDVFTVLHTNLNDWRLWTNSYNI